MVGLGYRKDFGEEFNNNTSLNIDFIEVAPENWVEVGGFWKKQFLQAIEKYPLFCHGLSLSIGSPDPLDFDFLAKVKKFLKETGAQVYSEHLSFAKCDNAHLYDLLPIPFTEEALKFTADRIRTVQDFLEQSLPVEIVSYYSEIAADISEIDFINGIVQEANCELLLDVNNVYVNSFNHQYNPRTFLDKLNMEKVRYIHMAGHLQVNDHLIIDTHGENIIDPVYDLLRYSLQKLNRDVPILLERDFNMPELESLQEEIDQLRAIKSSIPAIIHHDVA